ncbi:hypothetical protein V1517DRAFT_327209 [Lipomyces orientalis]|uniref:Uncharacterized protein n=1 Tax=Lipomyces orientalis TaxID=1233043 RepID=A0ACC3TJ55_9ASCO
MTSATSPSPERRRRSRAHATPTPDSPISDRTESASAPAEEEREEEDDNKQVYSGDPSAAEPEQDDDDDDDDDGDHKMKEDETSSPVPAPRSLPALAPAPPQSSTPAPVVGSAGRKGPRRRQPPHYREIRARVQSISEKFLPILGDIALANVGQLRVEDLSSKINAVYGELILLRRFLEQDSPDDISLANNSIITAAPGGPSPVPPSASQFQTLQMQVVGPDGNPLQSSDAETNGHADHPAKRQRLVDEVASPAGDEMIRPVFQGIAHAEPPKDLSAGSTPAPANPNLPLSDADLHIPVVETYRVLAHSSRPSYDTGVSLLNEKRREKLWAVMQNEIFTFAVGYNSTPLRTTEDFCTLAYSQDGRMKRTLKNDLAISEALFDGVSGFRKRLYQTDAKHETDDGVDDGEGSGLKDCGIRTYTNNLYSLKTKPQNYYHYLFAAAFWRWVRDEIDSKTVVSSSAIPSAQPEFAVNSVEDWWRECVSICNGFLKANPGRPEKKAFLKERLLADEKKYVDK